MNITFVSYLLDSRLQQFWLSLYEVTGVTQGCIVELKRGQGEVCILYIIPVCSAICLAVTFRGDYDKNTSHARSLGTRCYVATRQRASSVSGGRRYGRYGGFIVNDLLKLVVFLVFISLCAPSYMDAMWWSLLFHVANLKLLKCQLLCVRVCVCS